MVVGQVAVLLDELLDTLLKEFELVVDDTPLLVLLEESEVLRKVLENVLNNCDVVETLLVVLLRVAGIVEASEVELVRVIESAFDVVLKATSGIGVLTSVVASVDVVTETVTKAYK